MREKILRIADTTPRYHVYAVFCQDVDSGGIGFVKFGHSSQVGQRIMQVRSGSPIPAKMFAVAETLQNKESVLKVERRFLKEFEDRIVRGEWFKFNFSSAADKKEFNSGSKRCFLDCYLDMKDIWWTTINVAAYDQYQREGQQAWAKRHGKKLAKINKARELERKKVREFEKYRGRA